MAFAFDLSQAPMPTPSTSLSFSGPQKTTLWMGELDPWMDEQYIRQLWFNLNEKVLVKVIRDKVTGASAGYAFVDFGSPAAAQRALKTFNGTLIPNTHKQFKLNWASGGGLIDRREDRQPEYSIFVGDLSPECTELSLLTAFQAHYPSCKSAKIMTDPRTGMTRGYGFVRFTDQNDQQRALIEMQGFFIGSRPIRVSVATPKNRLHSSAASSPPTKSPHQPLPTSFTDPTNTTVFVGGLSAPIREDELRQYFSPFGEITQVKIPPGKGCGFVQYVSRQSAEIAIQQMNGYQIGNSRIRLSWGRSQSDNGNKALHQQLVMPAHHQLPPPAISISSGLHRQPAYHPSILGNHPPNLYGGFQTSFPVVQQQQQQQPPVQSQLDLPFVSPSLKSSGGGNIMPHSSNFANLDSLLSYRREDAFRGLISDQDLFSTGMLLDKKATSAAATWRLNQVYAQ